MDKEHRMARRVLASVRSDLFKAKKSDRPSLFLGGLCDEGNAWRKKIKAEFRGDFSFIDPYDPDWEPENNIYDELTGLMLADHIIFYKGGKGSDKEKKFLAQFDKSYTESDDLDKIRQELRGITRINKKRATLCNPFMEDKASLIISDHFNSTQPISSQALSFQVISDSDNIIPEISKRADFPKHPDTIVINRGELFTGDREIRELDVYNYYSGVKSKMLPELKGRDLFLGIRLKGPLGPRGKPLIIRHPYGEKTGYIHMGSDEEFEKYHSGRMVEVHVTLGNTTPYYIVDFDSNDFGQAKRVTAEVADKMAKHPDVKSVEIRYTGKRGFHILGFLKKPQPIDKARETLKEWLKIEFEDDEDVVMGETPKDSKGALGLTSMKLNGGQIALWSMRTNGLCCVEVPRAQLEGFKQSEATMEKVYKKATGKPFPWGSTEKSKKMAGKVTASFVEAIIKKCPKKDKDSRPDEEQRWCLYTHDGDKLLGRHPSKEKALKQERAIQVNKHSNQTGCKIMRSEQALKVVKAFLVESVHDLGWGMGPSRRPGLRRDMIYFDVTAEPPKGLKGEKITHNPQDVKKFVDPVNNPDEEVSSWNGKTQKWEPMKAKDIDLKKDVIKFEPQIKAAKKKEM